MNNWKTKAVAAVLIVGAVLICTAIIESRRNNETAGKTVRVGTLSLLSSELPLDIAQEEHQFDKKNIKVVTVQFATANQLVEALARGDVDITPFNSVFPFLSAELTDPGKIKLFAVSDLTPGVRFDALLVRPDSPITSLKDLAGKKIGVFPGSTTTAFLKAYLAKNNIDSSTVTFVQIPPQDHIQALQSKSVDAIYSLEPTFSIATEVAGVRILDEGPYAKLFNHTPIGGGLISTKFINDEPALARAATDTFKETYGVMATNDALVRKVAQDKFKLTAKTAAKVGMVAMKDPDPELFGRFTDLVVSVGELKKKPDLSSIYYK